jgi:hypothetical protein
MVLIGMENQAHNAPEIIDPVRVVKRHTPAVRLGRKTAQEEHTRPFRQERLERMPLDVHMNNSFRALSY